METQTTIINLVTSAKNQAQFNLDGYEIRSRQDRDKNGGGLIVFVRRGIICKRISDFQLSFSECICSELTISKSKWLCFSICRPPYPGNLSILFEELSESFSKAILKYQNIIIMGNLKKLRVLLSTNLINFVTCLIKQT